MPEETSVDEASRTRTASGKSSPPSARQLAGLVPARWCGVEMQPVTKVQWVNRETLNANDWNPNHTAPPELRLLAISLLEDGWTMPIVARPDGTIIDGFHRWTVSDWPAIYAMTDGLVPVAFINDTDPAHQRMSTIRHNRARGTHAVVKMADIVAELVAMGVDPAEVERRLQMEDEEVERLLDRGKMTKRGRSDDFGKGWVPD